MKFGICNEMYVNRTVEQVFSHAAGLGYDGVELAPFTLAEDPRTLSEKRQREVARCAEEHGIAVLGLHWLLAKPAGLHILAEDAPTRQRTRDFFRKLLEISTNTGGRILTLGSPKQRNCKPGVSFQTAMERAAEFFEPLIPEFEKAGAVLSLEPLEASATNFLIRTAQACALADRLASPAVGVTLDTHFMRWEAAQHDTPMREAFAQTGERLAHLHIQDDNDRACGTGGADFAEYAEIVKSLAWEGYVCLETFGHFGEGEGEQMAKASIRFLRELFGQ